MKSKKDAAQRQIPTTRTRFSFRNACFGIFAVVVISVVLFLIQLSKLAGGPSDDPTKGQNSIRPLPKDMRNYHIDASTSGSQTLSMRSAGEYSCTPADVKKHHGKVVLTTTNAAFVDIADNWLESIRRTRVCPNITMVAEDEKTVSHYSHKTATYPGLQVILTKTGTVSPHFLKFNTKPFKRFVNKRQRYILERISEGREVLFTDVDTFWLKDPFPYFTGDFDLAVERDLPHFYCAGFVYFKPTNNTVAFLREWIQFMAKDRTMKPDQKVMNDLIKSRQVPGLKVKILDSVNFPNGKLFFNKKWRGDKKREIVVVHNNWIVGHDAKVVRFKNCGMWLVGAENGR